jgi:LacI family transcriptional regulator
MKKIAIAINLDWPLKRYHDLYAGIQKYNNEFTNWTLVWDHFPEIYLRQSNDVPYYDGIIGRIKYDTYFEAKRLNVPLVNTWQTSSLTDEIPSVLVDYRETGRLAAEHLIKRGFRNFANIDYRMDKGSKEFYKGFSEVVKPCKGFFKRYLFSRSCDETIDQWEHFHKNFASWVKEWKFPIGIGCAVSSIGPKVSTRLIEHGINIPNEASLVTVGNDLIYCEGHSPRISSVSMDYTSVGYEAAKMMDILLQKKVLPKTEKIISPTGVISRESTDTYAIDDLITKLALIYISDNYNKSIQVTDIVEKTPIGRRALEMRFKKAVGHTISEEINRLRVNSLKRLLLETDDKINLLYAQLGFSSAQHMRRVFKKSTGMTPGEFRVN